MNNQGIWSEYPRIPRSDWYCTSIADAGDIQRICMWYGVAHVRFIHTMQHEKWHFPLEVGCICAGRIENDLEKAERREKALRLRASKRKRWVSRNLVSVKGNAWLRYEGKILTIFQRKNGFAFVIADGDRLVYSPATYTDSEEAKLAVFDNLYPSQVKER